MSSSSLRLSLHLLADARHKLVALQVSPVGAVTADDPPYADLAGVCAIFPCLVAAADAARLPPALLESMIAAGCKVAAEGAMGVFEKADAPPQPPKATYLGGDWYLRPQGKPGASQTSSRTLALKLAQLIASDAETHVIEDVFRIEPTLAYNLMRLVNSPGIGSGRRIDNFAQAIMMLGRRQLRRWLNLILFSSQKGDPRSAMLLAHVAVRARMLEQLAREVGYDKETQDRAFMVGMFSLLGVMFGMPLAEVLQPLKLDPELNAALLGREGEMGHLLTAVEAIEQGDPAQALALLDALLPAVIDLDPLLIDAHVWMLALIRESGEGAHG